MGNSNGNNADNRYRCTHTHILGLELQKDFEPVGIRVLLNDLVGGVRTTNKGQAINETRRH